MYNWFPRFTGSPPLDTWATIDSSGLAGTATWSFTATPLANLSVTGTDATIDGTGVLPATFGIDLSSALTTWSFSTAGNLDVVTAGVADLAGDVTWSFTATPLADLDVIVYLGSSATWSFTTTPSANLQVLTPGVVDLVGTATWSFTATPLANLTAQDPGTVTLEGLALLSFTTTPVARLSAISQISATAALFDIKRQGRVWLEYDSNFYLLHTTKDVSFSQTFRQTSSTKRTLHSLNSLFDGSVINKANPADFRFEILLINDDGSPIHQHLPLDLLLQYNGNTLNTFNLYFVYLEDSREVYYKIENCVFTGGTFNISRVGILSVALTGQGSKLTRTSDVFTGTDSGYALNPDIAVSKEILVTVDSDVLTNIIGVNLEVSNEIEWLENNTLQKSLAVTNTSNTTFPESFVLTGRKLAGSVQQYVTSVSTSNSNLQTWKEDTTVRIQAGNSTSNICLDVYMAGACSFTNRLDMRDVFTQNYDFRLMTSPVDLKNYFNY